MGGRMRWFGGSVTDAARLMPVGGRLCQGGPAPLWLVGEWPGAEVKLAGDANCWVAVIGPCGATGAEVAALLDGLPDSVALAWPGSYTVVRSAGGATTILTDPAGSSPIYMVSVAGSAGMGTVWASASRALAPLAGGEVDPVWLATNLLTPAAAGGTGRSAFKGVAFVPAGQRLTLRPGRRPLLGPVWRSDPISHREAPARLRAALDSAVTVRVGASERPTADCSGGLDSTSLCLLAAASRPVVAVTVHPAGIDAGGDLDYARAATAGRADIEHVLLPLNGDHVPYAGLDRVPVTDEPAPSTLTYARLSAQYRLLAEHRSDCHLTGDGGDTLFCLPPQYLADLLRAGRLARLARDVQGWARLRQVSPWPILAAALSAGLWRRRQPRWSSYASDDLPASGWATPLARELAREATSRPSLPGLDTAGLATMNEIRSVARTARADVQLAEWCGVRLHNPLLDAQVVDTVLGVPAWRRGSPRSYKPLLAASVADLLPAVIAGRGTKGSFDADHYRGLRVHLDAVLDLAGGRLAALGLVDPAGLRATLELASAGLPVAFADFEPVLAAEVWLRRLAIGPPITWTAAPAVPDQARV